jgi:hypothetical protein
MRRLPGGVTLLHVLAFAATAHAQITWPDLTTWCDLWRSDKVCEGYQTRYVEADCPTYAPYDCVWSTTECEMSAADTADWDYGRRIQDHAAASFL